MENLELLKSLIDTKDEKSKKVQIIIDRISKSNIDNNDRKEITQYLEEILEDIYQTKQVLSTSLILLTDFKERIEEKDRKLEKVASAEVITEYKKIQSNIIKDLKEAEENMNSSYQYSIKKMKIT